MFKHKRKHETIIYILLFHFVVYMMYNDIQYIINIYITHGGIDNDDDDNNVVV